MKKRGIGIMEKHKRRWRQKEKEIEGKKVFNDHFMAFYNIIAKT